jgi:hypothetical protein
MQGDERVEDMKTKKAGRQVQRDARMCVASMCCEYVHEEDVWQSMASAKPARGTPQASEPSKSWSTSIHGVMTRLRKSGESHEGVRIDVLRPFVGDVRQGACVLCDALSANARSVNACACYLIAVGGTAGR